MGKNFNDYQKSGSAYQKTSRPTGLFHNVNLLFDPLWLRNKHLVDHTKKQNMLYCKLTGRSIRNETIHIQRHLKGKKFKRSLEYCKYLVCTNNQLIVMAFVSNNISYVHTWRVFLGRECEKNGQVFKPMRCWGSIRDTEFLQERLEDIVGDGADDDTSDLHPWKKNEIRGKILSPLIIRTSWLV